MATITWIAGSAGNWSSGINWSGGVAPGVSDDVVFDGTGTGNCTLDVNVSVISISVNSGYTGTLAGATYNVDLSGAFTASSGILDFGSGTWTVGGNISLVGASSFVTGTATVKAVGTGVSVWLGNNSSKVVDTFEVASGATASTPYYSYCNNLNVVGTLTTTGGALWRVYEKTTVSGTLNGSAGHDTNDLEIQAGGTVSKSGTVYVRKQTTSSSNPVITGGGSCTSSISFNPNQGGSIATFTVYLASDFELDGDLVFGAGIYTGTVTFAPSNYNLTLRGDVNISPTTTLFAWSAGTGTITLDNTSAQAIDFNGETVEAIIVSDASTGAITLGANFTTPYVHDCNNLIDLNGYTITETGTDPSPCVSYAGYYLLDEPFKRL